MHTDATFQILPRITLEKLTPKWIHSDFFSDRQCFFDVFLLNTLYTQILKRCHHILVIYLYGTDAFLTTLFTDQIVRVSLKWFVFGNTRNHYYSWSFISYDLKQTKKSMANEQSSQQKI